MQAISATKVRNEWSSISESVIREKPAFIKKTRDYMFLSDLKTIEYMLSAYSFTADVFFEEDGSVTLSLREMDLVENGIDETDAVVKMAHGILEYSEDYYSDFTYWARGSRKSHLPYVFKALILGDPEKIGGLIQCHRGET